jgi:predicted RNase H-like HicB family nuclease
MWICPSCLRTLVPIASTSPRNFIRMSFLRELYRIVNFVYSIKMEVAIKSKNTNPTSTWHGTYPIVLQKEKEGGYSVTNLALEGCYSQGETVEEALRNIKEATLLCLEDDTTSQLESTDVSIHLITV